MRTALIALDLLGQGRESRAQQYWAWTAVAVRAHMLIRQCNSLRHPRAGGDPSDEGEHEDKAGDGFPPARE